MRASTLGRVLLAAVTALIPMVACAAPTYTVQSIGALPTYEFSTLSAINDLNQVAGTSYRARAGIERDSTQGFLYSQGSMTAMGFLPGHNTSVALGINNSGHVVGESWRQVNGGAVEGYAAMFNAGAISSLGAFAGANYSVATGINDAGQAVGGGHTPATQALLFQNGDVQIVGNFVNSYATAINSSAAIVGYWWDSQTPQSAFVWQNGTAQNIAPLPGYQTARALGINDSGAVVGYDYNTTTGRTTAWIKSGSQVTSIRPDPSRNSVANGINNAGAAVGWLEAETGEQAAFLFEEEALWTIDSLLDPISAGRWSILSAVDINNNGWIVADALDRSTGLVEGVILQRVAANDVPEPVTFLLVCTALASMLLARRSIARGTSGRQATDAPHGPASRAELASAGWSGSFPGREAPARARSRPSLRPSDNQGGPCGRP